MKCKMVIHVVILLFKPLKQFLSRLQSRRETYVLLIWRHRQQRRKLFCVLVILLDTIRARAMKLGSCIHLEELRSTLLSILSIDLHFTVH